MVNSLPHPWTYARSPALFCSLGWPAESCVPLPSPGRPGYSQARGGYSALLRLERWECQNIRISTRAPVHNRLQSSLSFWITRPGNCIRNRPVCVRKDPQGLWDWESRSWWPSGQRKCHSLIPSIFLVKEQNLWFWRVTDLSALYCLLS